jgi:hypothetical protein
MCDLLLAHKHELEHLLTELFRQADPSVIGNNYLIIGTVEKSSWREGLAQPSCNEVRLNTPRMLGGRSA